MVGFSPDFDLSNMEVMEDGRVCDSEGDKVLIGDPGTKYVSD